MNIKQKLLLTTFIGDTYNQLYKITLENVNVADINQKQVDYLKSKLNDLETLINQIIEVGEKK